MQDRICPPTPGDSTSSAACWATGVSPRGGIAGRWRWWLVGPGPSVWPEIPCPGGAAWSFGQRRGSGPWGAAGVGTELSPPPQPPSPRVGIPGGSGWFWITRGNKWLSTLPSNSPLSLLSKKPALEGRASSLSSGWGEAPTSASSHEP